MKGFSVHDARCAPVQRALADADDTGRWSRGALVPAALRCGERRLISMTVGVSMSSSCFPPEPRPGFWEL
jgi:hypothetical protein